MACATSAAIFSLRVSLMSFSRRYIDIKLTRRENIAALVAQAIELWLDVQEGKRKVEKL